MYLVELHELHTMSVKWIKYSHGFGGVTCLMLLLLLQDLEGEREVNKEEVLEYCNSSDVNVPLIETSAKVCSPASVHFRQYLPIAIGTKAGEGFQLLTSHSPLLTPPFLLLTPQSSLLTLDSPLLIPSSPLLTPSS